MNEKDLSKEIIRHSELFADVMSACQTLLKHSKQAEPFRNYLNNRIPLKIQKEFNFGYFPPNEFINELFDLISIDVLKELNLVYDKKASDIDVMSDVPVSIFNNHNLIMPYKNLYGDIVSIVGRTLLDKDQQKELRVSKYKNTKFQKRLHLYALYKAKHEIIKQNCVILVEGQFDCIACHRFGFRNVVAVGSANLSKFQFYLIKRYTDNIYLLFDNDKAGQLGANKAIKRYSDSAFIKNIILPNKYKDVDEYLCSNSSADILDFLK